MRVLIVAIPLGALAVWLTFYPMFDAPRRGQSAWPWIFGGWVAGPLSGLVYLMTRRGLAAATHRNAEPLDE
jgi:hypothetical protein